MKKISKTRPARTPAGGTTSYFNPATGELIGQAVNTDLSKLPEIFARARRAQAHWAAL
jgi:acyl-CoA reductase-like NAD-dependent aldehyde dehydrogenase